MTIEKQRDEIKELNVTLEKTRLSILKGRIDDSRRNSFCSGFRFGYLEAFNKYFKEISNLIEESNIMEFPDFEKFYVGFFSIFQVKKLEKLDAEKFYSDLLHEMENSKK